jgi:hypothetical protein
MLRFIYRALLRLHPPYFRRRFATEMLAIFDRTGGTLAALRLIADAASSLARQWVLRPEFWYSPRSQPASDGVPLFHTFESFKPRTSALLDGAVLTVAVFSIVLWTMSYAWNHPVLIQIVPPHWGHRHENSQKLPTAAGTPKAAAPAEEPLYTDAGRVVMIFKRPQSSTAPAAQINRQLAGPGSSAVRPSGSPFASLPTVPEQVLRSYAGTFVVGPPNYMRLSITLDRGQLAITAGDQTRTTLVPVSDTKFLIGGTADGWIEFSKNQDRLAQQVDIYQAGSHLTAYRR